MQIRYKIVIIGLLILSSCNNVTTHINKKTISELASSDFRIPSVHGFLLLFISVENDEMAQTNVDALYYIYSKHYFEKYRDFESFLSGALNQKIILKKNDFEQQPVLLFKINSSVKQHYNDLPLNGFINIYFSVTDSGVFFVKNEYKVNNKLMSILYYLFVNNYEITSDDYLGRYYAKKSKND